MIQAEDLLLLPVFLLPFGYVLCRSMVILAIYPKRISGSVFYLAVAKSTRLIDVVRM